MVPLSHTYDRNTIFSLRRVCSRYLKDPFALKFQFSLPFYCTSILKKVPLRAEPSLPVKSIKWGSPGVRVGRGRPTTMLYPNVPWGRQGEMETNRKPGEKKASSITAFRVAYKILVAMVTLKSKNTNRPHQIVPR